PSRTGVNILPDNMAKIAKLPYIAGIKEASGNLSQITQIVRLCPNTAVYCGDDTLALPAYAVGCRGIISVASNLDMDSVKQVWNLYNSGKPCLALTYFQKALPFYESLFRVVNPIPIKYELAKQGLIKNVLRLPLLPIQ
ncbi:MAG: dihydrodipicolinate synthase family protein, partial [Clostridia bacterium]|nr:dihydrodipicolinate synthase family protein [Clostridia bacterium]